MIATRHSKREAIQLDRAWRQALGARAHRRRRFDDGQLATWRERAREGLRFLQVEESVAGKVEFEPDEIVPHPEGVWRTLGGGSIWFLGIDLDWAVYGDHEDWTLVERADTA
jgi:hypothetical protein